MLCRVASSAASVKLSTGLTGLEAVPEARQRLSALYADIQKSLAEFPADYAYARGLQALMSERLHWLGRSDVSDVDLEAKWGEGQLEEVLEQGEREASLLARMKEWRPWQTAV